MTQTPADTETYRYVDPTDAFGNTLTVVPVDASTYTGTTPVVSLGITLNPEYTDPENPIVYVPLDDVEQVVKAIRTAAGQPETDEQRVGREEAERLHAAGDHQCCGATCEVEMPSVLLRNFIVAKGYPGTAGALDELLRRAALTVPPGVDRAAVLRKVDWVVEHCPDHGCVEPETDDCHCEIADRFRRLVDEAQQQSEPPTHACSLCDVVKPNEYALRDHVLNVHPDEFCGVYHGPACRHEAQQPAPATTEESGR